VAPQLLKLRVGVFHRVSEVCPSAVAPHFLKLKVGAFHRVTKESESQNGAIMVVITGNNRGERVSTTRTNLEPSEGQFNSLHCGTSQNVSRFRASQ